MIKRYWVILIGTTSWIMFIFLFFERHMLHLTEMDHRTNWFAMTFFLLLAFLAFLGYNDSSEVSNEAENSPKGKNHSNCPFVESGDNFRCPFVDHSLCSYPSDCLSPRDAGERSATVKLGYSDKD